MAGNRWLCVSIAISLMTAVVIGEGELAQDRDMRNAQIQIEASPLASGDDTAVVAEFQRRLWQYDAVRRRLDAALPVQAVSSDPAETLTIIQAHQTALRSARHTARQGDMFFPSIAAQFRHWILDALHGMTTKEFLLIITEEDAPPMALPCVNAPYQDGAPLTTMPPQLLQILPRLPLGLEYRFIDRDLILWDPHANLIIDFISHALSDWDES